MPIGDRRPWRNDHTQFDRLQQAAEDRRDAINRLRGLVQSQATPISALELAPAPEPARGWGPEVDPNPVDWASLSPVYRPVGRNPLDAPTQIVRDVRTYADAVASSAQMRQRDRYPVSLGPGAGWEFHISDGNEDMWLTFTNTTDDVVQIPSLLAGVIMARNQRVSGK